MPRTSLPFSTKTLCDAPRSDDTHFPTVSDLWPGFFGLFNATDDGGGPLAAPRTLDTLLSLDKGDGAGGAWLLSIFAALAFPRAQVWGDVGAIARTDAAYHTPQRVSKRRRFVQLA